MSDVGGLLLGKFENAEDDMSTIQLEPGDSIVTFTDGVTEAENDSGGFFDEERVINYLEKSANKKLNPLVKGLFLEVMKFAGTAPQSDDITVLTTRYEGN
jgi:sigma-B regulation protein RsbU (phosphoserine phosphatase)